MAQTDKLTDPIENILLAKILNMYYSIPNKSLGLRCSILPAILILFISIFTFQTNAFADKFQIAEDYRLKGFEEQGRGNLDNALQWYAKSLSLVENNAVVYNDMAVVYEQLGILERAENHYLRALQVNPEYLPPYMNLAYLYLQKGDSNLAAEYFEMRIDKGRRNDPWAKRARAELIKIDPDREKKRRARIAQEVTRMQEEFVLQVREDFQKQIIRAEKHFHSGRKMAESGEYEKAVVEFDRALLLTPDNPKILRAKNGALKEQLKKDVANHSDEAVRYLDEGDADAAKNEIRKILTIIPNELNL